MDEKAKRIEAEWNRFRLGFRSVAEACARAKDEGLTAGFAFIAWPLETPEQAKERRRIGFARRNAKDPKKRRNYHESQEYDALRYAYYQRSKKLEALAQEWAKRQCLPCERLVVDLVDYGGLWGTSSQAGARLKAISEQAGSALPGNFYDRQPLFDPPDPVETRRNIPDTTSYWWQFVATTFPRQFNWIGFDGTVGTPPHRRGAAVTIGCAIALTQQAAEWLASASFEEVESVYYSGPGVERPKEIESEVSPQVRSKSPKTPKRPKSAGRPPSTFRDGMPKPTGTKYHEAAELLPEYFDQEPDRVFNASDFATWAITKHGVRVPDSFGVYWDKTYRRRFKEWFRRRSRPGKTGGN